MSSRYRRSVQYVLLLLLGDEVFNFRGSYEELCLRCRRLGVDLRITGGVGFGVRLEGVEVFVGNVGKRREAIGGTCKVCKVSLLLFLVSFSVYELLA